VRFLRSRNRLKATVSPFIQRIKTNGRNRLKARIIIAATSVKAKVKSKKAKIRCRVY
jgi:hypothetical protein